MFLLLQMNPLKWIELILRKNGKLLNSNLLRDGFLIYIAVTFDHIWRTINDIIHDLNIVNLYLLQILAKSISILTQSR